MPVLLLLAAVLSAPDGGAARQPMASSARAQGLDGGTRAGPADAGTHADAGTAARDGGTRALAEGPEPSTRVAVQEPPRPDAGSARKKKARVDRPDGQQSDPQMDALLEQQRAQTQALQELAAGQRAAEQARVAEQQSRNQRAALLEGARNSLDGTLQSLQSGGNWDGSALASARVSLQQSSAAASTAGAHGEASRAAEAARLVEAAEAALVHRNSQQAQYYLMQASQLLAGAQNLR